MEIVQTMNSDPGLAVGKQIDVSLFVLDCIRRRFQDLDPQNVLRQFDKRQFDKDSTNSDGFAVTTALNE